VLDRSDRKRKMPLTMQRPFYQTDFKSPVGLRVRIMTTAM
jgi:hypothetical protein